VWLTLIVLIIRAAIASTVTSGLAYAKAREGVVATEANKDLIKGLRIAVDRRMQVLQDKNDAMARAEGMIKETAAGHAEFKEESSQTSEVNRQVAEAILKDATIRAEAILEEARIFAREKLRVNAAIERANAAAAGKKL